MNVNDDAIATAAATMAAAALQAKIGASVHPEEAEAALLSYYDRFVGELRSRNGAQRARNG
jgi:hypothetical protein